MSDEQQRWPEPVYLTKDHAINMSLRDYFAAKVLQGMAAKDVFDAGQSTPEQRAKLAYIDADAMMKAREQ